MPDFDGFPLSQQVAEVTFEVAVYELLRDERTIAPSLLLYHRTPAQHCGPWLEVPNDLAGRRLFVFEKARGEANIRENLDPAGKVRSDLNLPPLLSPYS